jgi:hypothetical protein
MRNDMTAFLLAQLNFEFHRKLVIKLPTQAQQNFAFAAIFLHRRRMIGIESPSKG